MILFTPHFIIKGGCFMVSKKIRGIDASKEFDRKKMLRDIRPLSVRITDMCNTDSFQLIVIFGLIPMVFMFTAFAIPLFCIGFSCFVFRLFNVQNQRLPFRMPLGLSGVDTSDPKPGRTGFSQPKGTFFVGNSINQEELWLKSEDILTHAMIFGTTGSGKTETLVSLSYNPLSTGSGLFYIDPKASPKLAVQIWQMARYLGRDDDFRVLNYGTSGKSQEKSPSRLSSTTNPFTVGSAEALTQLLVSLMPTSDGNAIFADKAQALISGVMYALVDLRDKGLVKISTASIRDALQLEKCINLALRAELSDQARASIQAALATSGWISGCSFEEQPEAFTDQFGYAQGYFGNALSSLTDTYSHIYSAEDGEVDFVDVIMQRRILVVLLPSLEKSPAELASLGKISLSSVKTACAVGLGSIIEGDASDVLESLPTQSTGIGEFLVVVDEYAAIVTPGFEIVLTQGRGLGISSIIASQDYAGILEADRKGAQQMVANTALKVFMKLQDAESTFELAKKIAGEGTIAQTTGYSIDKNQEFGGYQDNYNVELRRESRIELRDLQEQIQGEAHFIFNGQVVMGETFFANPSLKNAQLRVPQLIQCNSGESNV